LGDWAIEAFLPAIIERPPAGDSARLALRDTPNAPILDHPITQSNAQMPQSPITPVNHSITNTQSSMDSGGRARAGANERQEACGTDEEHRQGCAEEGVHWRLLIDDRVIH